MHIADFFKNNFQTFLKSAYAGALFFPPTKTFTKNVPFSKK